MAVAAVLSGCDLFGGDDSEAPEPAAKWNPQAGLPLSEPEQLFADGGVLEVALTAEKQTIDVSGSEIEARPWNGALIGPTLHVAPGERLEVSFDNRTKEPTNIHYHGLHVSPRGDSDNVFRKFKPNTVSSSIVDVPADHATGTFWYHVHFHGNTDPQVAGGLSGLLIIEGLEEKLPPELQEIEQRQLAIRDVQVDKAGSAIVRNPADIAPDKPTTRLVNGLLEPKFDLRSGETQLWRLANVGADLFYRVGLEGHEFTVIAEDGNPVWETSRQDRLLMPPGKRFDVLVSGGDPGSYELRTYEYDEGFQRVNDAQLATVHVGGPRREPTEALLDPLVPEADLSEAEVAREREFTFNFDTSDGQFLAEINGHVFDPNTVNVTAGIDTVEEWTLRNRSNEDHPFHIHVNDFQVMSVNGRPYDARGLQDVVVIPKNGGEVVIRNLYETFTGEFVFHCHILGHEDAGMMQTVKVVDGPGLPTRESRDDSAHAAGHG